MEVEYEALEGELEGEHVPHDCPSSHTHGYHHWLVDLGRELILNRPLHFCTVLASSACTVYWCCPGDAVPVNISLLFAAICDFDGGGI